ncbi:single-stranded DNA-binding protein [Phormidium sp. CLA17]|uniref:single-stranded DNA-binding protein n=1 Tax=Leptolyngbya sp. Cla-17 TaxID=2803751 RepID=UPI001490D7E5|nr:single-stranded DNA-binding protein [Leptolyngbya sp. Cla-17]MBM0743138.1 single-stranded DNA-binding protein [Leptolyngbya sp. Cla-17]
MNQCILMADIIQEPELRYTSDNQTPLAEMVVQFAGIRPEDPPSTLKVIGWGNLAQEIQATYHEGDRVVIEGRLNMNTIDRPEGFKEKRAELTATRVHRLASDTVSTSTTTALPTASTASQPTATPKAPPAAYKAKEPAGTFQAPPESNLDDIPF